MSFECNTCTRIFYTERSRSQHMNDTDHWGASYACETCDDLFPSLPLTYQHMNRWNHWALRYPCETCSDEFCSEMAAENHMAEEGHYRDYCKQCDRRFVSHNNLRMHLNSRVHRGSSITCFFCESRYTTASGLVHHLETGSCLRAPKLNRETILAMVRERDPHGVITMKQIGWRDEPAISYSATNAAFNGEKWECYLCHKKFNSVKALNSHLNSPTHKKKVYQCPNARAGCQKQFVSLAAFAAHLESEACGYTRFEQVQEQVTQIFDRGRMIGF